MNSTPSNKKGISNLSTTNINTSTIKNIDRSSLATTLKPKEQRLVYFIFRSSSYAFRILRESLAAIKRWLEFSCGALIISFRSVATFLIAHNRSLKTCGGETISKFHSGNAITCLDDLSKSLESDKKNTFYINNNNYFFIRQSILDSHFKMNSRQNRYINLHNNDDSISATREFEAWDSYLAETTKLQNRTNVESMKRELALSRALLMPSSPEHSERYSKQQQYHPHLRSSNLGTGAIDASRAREPNQNNHRETRLHSNSTAKYYTTQDSSASGSASMPFATSTYGIRAQAFNEQQGQRDFSNYYNDPYHYKSSGNSIMYSSSNTNLEPVSREENSLLTDKVRLNGVEEDRNSLVLVSKRILNNLTDQITSNMNRMKDLEEQIKVIPQLQERLNNVINDNSNNRHSTTIAMLDQYNSNQNSTLYTGASETFTFVNNNNLGEQENLINNAFLSQTTPTKCDASTNTDLMMNDIVTKNDYNNMLLSIHKTYSTLSSSILSLKNVRREEESSRFSAETLLESNESSEGTPTTPETSPSTNESVDEPRSSSSRSNSTQENSLQVLDENEYSSQNASATDNESISNNKSCAVDSKDNQQQDSTSEEEEEDDRSSRASVCSSLDENPEEAYSLGSSYQDPSDFEEYCAYGESLDRRTKDFMSQSTKIPNDLRFALIRLNDFIKNGQHSSTSTSDTLSSSTPSQTSSCMQVIMKEWFDVASKKDSQVVKTKLYVDYFESFTKQLLNTVVNLADSAGNTIMHYAASHYRLDIVKVLLDTKVCDVNCRNKAGYTSIMLLALTDIKEPKEQEIAYQLFTMGDVNIKARSSGQTALMLAASNGRLETCKLLLKCGADPSLQDFDGSTALMCGSELGNEDVVKCLLTSKLTDPFATDNDGLDALTIAMNNGHRKVGLLLYAAGNVPRMAGPPPKNGLKPTIPHLTNTYLEASLRKSRAKMASNYVRRADSLLSSRGNRSIKN